jgi:thiamine-phosphate pyrophosphorylase
MVTDRRVVSWDALARRIRRAGELSRPTRRRAVRGRAAVLLRDKDLDPAQRREVAETLRALTREEGLELWVAADVDLAASSGADGVHLPSSQAASVADVRARIGDGAWLSVACHAPAEAVAAAAAGANGVLVSPIFDSPGKGPALGTSALVETRRLLAGAGTERVAVIALGGVDASRAEACFAAGASAVAAIRADLTELLSRRG